MKHKASQNPNLVSILYYYGRSLIWFLSTLNIRVFVWDLVGLVDSLDMSMLDLCVNFFEQFLSRFRNERERQFGRQFVVELDWSVGQARAGGCFYQSDLTECWPSLRSHISSFITSNTKMKVAGIGQGRRAGQLWCRHQTLHSTLHWSPGQARRGCANKYFYARRMCTGGTGDYLCIVLQYMNGSCQEFWEDSAPTSWHKDYKM